MADGIHLEVTTKCIASCPKCPRTIFLKQINAVDISLDVLKRITGRHWKWILLCGDHGDAIYHSKFHQILEHLISLDYNPTIKITTCGSHRKPDWWKTTASLLRKNDVMTFSLDGLMDTNHIYRVNTDWKSIMTGVEIMQESSCQLVWKFIVFRHNQHQVLEAYKQAKRLGMTFELVNSSRFGFDDPMAPTTDFQELQRLIHDNP